MFLIIVLLISLACGSPVNKPVSRLQLASNNATNRIVGGLPSYPDQYPFMASVYSFSDIGTYFCGGTILNELWILTAAQCTQESGLYRISVGSVYLTAKDNDVDRQQTYCTDFVVHPDYDPSTFKSDIAVLKGDVQIPLLYTHYVSPIGKLPREDLEASKDGIALGWGQINNVNTDLSDVLLNVPLYTISLAQCQAAFGYNIVDENIVCLEGPRGEGACFGDTGGPFFAYEGTETVVLAISSFVSARGCGNPDPSGYTKVYPYVDWIESAITSI